MKMKYENLKELKEALDKGEITLDPGSGDYLTLESDIAYLYVDDECVFRRHPSDLIEEALDLLGIPWQNS
jgi:hypothetical protein